MVTFVDIRCNDRVACDTGAFISLASLPPPVEQKVYQSAVTIVEHCCIFVPARAKAEVNGCHGPRR